MIFTIFLTNNISYYYEQSQLEIERIKFKGNIEECYKFIVGYSDIDFISRENVNFDFEVFKTNLFTFKSKLLTTSYSYSDLHVLLLLFDSYLSKFPHLIQLVEAPSLHGYKPINDSDLGASDMSTIRSDEDTYYKSEFQFDTGSVISLSSIESKEHFSNKVLESELDSSGLTSKESAEEVQSTQIGENSYQQDQDEILSKTISINESREVFQETFKKKHKTRKRRKRMEKSSSENAGSRNDLSIVDSRSSLQLPLYEKFKWCLELDYTPYLAYLPQVSTFREVLTPAISNLNNRLFLGAYDSRLFNSDDILKDFTDKTPMYDHFKDILTILNFYQKQISNIKMINKFSISIFLISSIINIVAPNENKSDYIRPSFFLLLVLCIYRTRSFIPKEMQQFNPKLCELEIRKTLNHNKIKKNISIFSTEQKEYLTLLQEKMITMGFSKKTYCTKKKNS